MALAEQENQGDRKASHEPSIAEAVADAVAKGEQEQIEVEAIAAAVEDRSGHGGRANTSGRSDAAEPAKDNSARNNHNRNNEKEHSMDKDTQAQAGGMTLPGFEDMFGTSNAMMTDYAEMARGNAEAVVESGRVLTTGMQELGRAAAEGGRAEFEALSADMRRLAGATSPTQMMQLQGEIARAYFDRAMAHGSKMSELFVKLTSDAIAPVSHRMNAAADEASKAA